MTTTTKINEKPILFSTPLVQAILEGRKTQTRRVIKPQPEMFGNWSKEYPEPKPEPLSTGLLWSAKIDGKWEVIKSPYGKPGDELYVRETHTFWEDEKGLDHIKYKVGDPVPIPNTKKAADYVVGRFDKWRPSIHMPRWVSRIQLTVTDIRVERVQDISEEDALDEGVELDPDIDPTMLNYWSVRAFEKLWDSINADRGYSWESNPFVWVISFKVKEVKGGSL